MKKIREKIFSLGTLYSFILLLSIYFIIDKNQEEKKTTVPPKLIDKSGIIFEIGSDIPYTGQIKDTVQDKIIEYYLIDGKKYGDFKVSRLNGTIEINGIMDDNKNEGVWNYYYPNGTLESRGTFYNDQLNGVWKWYFPNGKLKTVGYFLDNQKIGTWKFYDENSRLVQEISYRNDSIELIRNYRFVVSL